MTTLRGLHHVALTVGDRDASAAWYASVLGLQELFREDGDDRRACVMRFADGSYSVGLVEHRPGDPAAFDPRRRGLDHLAFTVGTRDELDEWVERLDAAGAVHSGVADVPPGAILNFRDPDGLPLALFWDRS